MLVITTVDRRVRWLEERLALLEERKDETVAWYERMLERERRARPPRGL